MLEYIIRDIYDDVLKPKGAGTQPLEGLVQTLVKEGQFPVRLAAYADMVRGLGNVGVHAFDKGVNSQDVLNSLSNLMPIVEWFFEHRKMPGGEVAPFSATTSNSPTMAMPSGRRTAGPADAEPQPSRRCRIRIVRRQARRRMAPRRKQDIAAKWIAMATRQALGHRCGARDLGRLWNLVRHASPRRAGSEHQFDWHEAHVDPGRRFYDGLAGERNRARSPTSTRNTMCRSPGHSIGHVLRHAGQFARFVAATNYKTDAETDGVGGWGHTGDAKNPVP